MATTVQSSPLQVWFKTAGTHPKGIKGKVLHGTQTTAMPWLLQFKFNLQDSFFKKRSTQCPHLLNPGSLATKLPKLQNVQTHWYWAYTCSLWCPVLPHVPAVTCCPKAIKGRQDSPGKSSPNSHSSPGVVLTMGMLLGLCPWPQVDSG